MKKLDEVMRGIPRLGVDTAPWIYDVHARTVTFQDNGIGMDEQDIKDFLAVIGSTGTGASRQELEAQGDASAIELIGQFGIGLLAAFVVAEKVVVHTRKLGAAKAFAWHNAGSTACELHADDRAAAGSEIVVSVDRNYSYILDEKRLRDAVIKYCDFIPFPIRLNGEGPVNTVDAPWHREHGRNRSPAPSKRAGSAGFQPARG